VPYIDGKRVTLDEWQARYSSIQTLHTGPGGENPAPAATAPVAVADVPKAAQAKSSRSPKAAASAKAAIADAMGTKPDAEEIANIDVTGLDAGEDEEDA
jgi:hypothetical protein